MTSKNAPVVAQSEGESRESTRLSHFDGAEGDAKDQQFIVTDRTDR